MFTVQSDWHQHCSSLWISIDALFLCSVSAATAEHDIEIQNRGEHETASVPQENTVKLAKCSFCSPKKTKSPSLLVLWLFLLFLVLFAFLSITPCGKRAARLQMFPVIDVSVSWTTHRSLPVCHPGRSGPELRWCCTGSGWSLGSFHHRYSRNRQPGRPGRLWLPYRLDTEREAEEFTFLYRIRGTV